MAMLKSVAQLASASPTKRFLFVGLCLFVVFINGYNFQSISVAIPQLSEAWNEPPEAFAKVLSATLIGLAIGGVLAGPCGEKFGRKPLLISGSLFFAASSLGMLVATDSWQVAILRLIASALLGAAVPNLYAVVADNSGSQRTFWMTMFTCIFAVGAASVGATAHFLTQWGGWQLIFTTGGVASLMAAIVIAAIFKEEPASSESHVEALAPELSQPQVLVAERGQAKKRQHLSALLTRRIRVRTLSFWAVWSVNSFTFNVLTSWTPTLLIKANYSIEAAQRASSLLWVGSIVGGLVIALLFQRFGSAIASFGASFAVAALAVALLWLIPSHAFVLLAGLLLLGGTIGGIQSAIPSVAPHIYPNSLIATGLGWAGSMARLGGIIAPAVGGWAVGAGASLTTILLFLLAPILLCGLLARFLDNRPFVGPA